MSELILGIDPDQTNVPSIYFNNGVLNSYNWGKDLIDTCHKKIVGVKFQSAYFESLGLQGLTDMAKLIAYSKSHDLITIMDAKRGDIGSTSRAYAKAFLENNRGNNENEFACDYLTVNPLMGEDCLDPFVEIALKNNKGLFILLETSNPGAEMILKASLASGEKVNSKIAAYINTLNHKHSLNTSEISPIGCVIGATNTSAKYWRKQLPNSLFLMPGIGAQGGSWDAVKSALTPNSDGVWVPISRGITAPSNLNISTANYLNDVGKKLNNFFIEIENIKLS